MPRIPDIENSAYWNEPVLAPTEVEHQHYVPQFYLRAFANVKGLIRVIDRQPPGREFETGIAAVAAQTRFYDFEVDGFTLSPESWLAGLEGSAAPVMRRLIDDPDAVLDLSTVEELVLARFLAAFRFRTPAFRDQLEGIKQKMVAFAKKIGTSYARNHYPEAQAEQVLKEWAEQPDEWWLGEQLPTPLAETTAGMLSEVQGYANLLRAKPWRVGRVPPEHPLYTSDNPLAGRLTPLHPWWEGGSFASLLYYVPLSPEILLQIDPMPKKTGSEPLDPRGSRRRRDFGPWQTLYAQKVVSSQARRFIFGYAPSIPREQAIGWLKHDDEVTRAWAMRFVGYDPRPPQIELPTR